LGVLSMQNAFLTFDELLAKIVDNVLKSIFSERFAFSVWTYLEMTVSIEPLDVARKPEAFSAGLRNLFGLAAAESLERLILKCLCQVLQINLELRESYRFSDYISELRKLYVKIEVERYKQLIK
jgi:hypothetical protein